jgi:hypothetical protein
MVGKNVKFWYLNEKRSTIVKTGTVLDKIIQKSNTAYIIKYMDDGVYILRIVKPDQIINLINN